MAGAPVLEPLEHLVLEKSLVSGFTEGAPVLELLEHSVLGEIPVGGLAEGTPVLEPLEHSIPEKTLDVRPMVGFAARGPLEHSVLDVDMYSLWEAGGTFRIGSRPEMAIRRDRLRCVQGPYTIVNGIAHSCQNRPVMRDVTSTAPSMCRGAR